MIRLPLGLTAVALAAPLMVAQTGELVGVVDDDNFRPVSGVRVLIQKHPPVRDARNLNQPIPEFRPFHATTSTDSNGNYSFKGLEPGLYSACVDATARRMIDPCLWTPQPATHSVADRKSTFAGLRVVQAHSLTVELTDAQGLVEKSGRPAAPDFSVMIGPTRFGYIPMTVRTRAGGRTYTADMPFGADVELRVRSRTLAVADSTNRRVGTERRDPPIKLRAERGAPPTTVRLAVTGTKQSQGVNR